MFAKFCDVVKSFQIPNFQRPYSWKNKQLQDFFKSIIENEREYFIGNIVAVAGQPIQIIDGQQRLTTISLLLLALRDILLEIETKNDKDKEIIDHKITSINQYIFYTDFKLIPARVSERLMMGKKIYCDVYNKIAARKISDIDIKKIGDSEKRILSNYKILRKLVEDYILISKLERLDEILEKTLSLQIILILCEEDNDIYRIFEGFNSTGLGLSVADLIKNSILKQTSEDKDIQNTVETIWLEIEELFDVSAGTFPKFLRYNWISQNGHILMSNLFGSIKESKINNKTPREILKYVSHLQEQAKIYSGLVYEEYEKFLEVDRRVLSAFKKFRFLRNEQVYEILLAYYNGFKNNKIKIGSLEKYLRKLWIFILRSRFISINPSGYEKIFADHCRDIEKTKDPNEFARYFDKFINDLKFLVNDDVQFIENFVSDIRYGTDNLIIKEALTEIMKFDNPNRQVSKPEIEHILPQEPRKWGLSRTDIRDHVHKIGNLTLLFEGDNRKVDNHEISQKVSVYMNTGFKMNDDISHKWYILFEKDWKSAIDARGLMLAQELTKIWKL